MNDLPDGLFQIAAQAPEPCGGCGEKDPDKRCTGCHHTFATPSPSLAVRDDAIQEVIGRLIKWETANGNDVYDANEVEELLALFRPQIKSDTSGLPG